MPFLHKQFNHMKESPPFLPFGLGMRLCMNWLIESEENADLKLFTNKSKEHISKDYKKQIFDLFNT